MQTTKQPLLGGTSRVLRGDQNVETYPGGRAQQSDAPDRSAAAKQPPHVPLRGARGQRPGEQDAHVPKAVLRDGRAR